MERIVARTRNAALEAAIAEAGWSQSQAAAQFGRVAAEAGLEELRGITRSHINQWIMGSQPSGQAPHILCETLSRGLGRPVTPGELGLASTGAEGAAARPVWSVDPLATLLALGDDDMDTTRRKALARAAFSAAGLALPGSGWWNEAAANPRRPHNPRGRTIGAAEVESVREATLFFSRHDQLRGGGAGRAAVIAYLRTDIAAYLGGSFATEQRRREMYTAAGEMAYLSGWMAFDAGHHGVAQRHFGLGVRLAAEAQDAPLAGHILRAMAHQAGDLGHHTQALDLATASVSEHRYTRASPRERALLGVVHARALASTGQRQEAMAALLRAEDDLRSTRSNDDEPTRVFFFAEASLAHETACALRDLGELAEAEKEFRRSVRLRPQPFARTQTVTLGYLGALQAQRGEVDAACATWRRALDTLETAGIQSSRARETVVQMRRALSPLRKRGGATAQQLDQRAQMALRRIG